MVGNDIVDLRDPDADVESYRPGFDARVFTSRERARIAAAPRPADERWTYWAAKEATYKLARRLDSNVIFAPQRFEVHAICRQRRAIVTHRTDRYFVEFDETPERIHAIAVRSESELDAVLSRVDSIDAGEVRNESAVVRRLACDTIAERMSIPPASLEIRATNRIPELIHCNQTTGVGVSLSHHGRWVAFACHQGEERVV